MMTWRLQTKAYNNVAIIYDTIGDLDNALEYHNKSLAIKLTDNEFHPDVASSYSNIAVVHHLKGDLDKAQEYNES